ncbi:NAD(P)H-dependent oxidoreductase [Neptunitalea lumnitzerae]|uniref:NAD(P)H-dependent oxidoreductase n=1 Tax=Neptunitalea lumnitzerae TaxID=2965509 RepID=A0ABQ5MNE6_9FLAO|nr:NAD(P)H-dependent oxidoreductase [Neptunitalea sp. Y10]GLB50920.1 NAD(P)H-dependent oxidoreductase [Neptunitalea sp. Y10]
MSTYIESLEWRYATKQFDSSKKISTDNLNILKEAVRLTASSYGMQPYEVFDVQNEEVREQLRAVGYNQPQITEASHLFVFAAKTDVTSADVDTYMKLVSETRNVPLENLEGFSGMINGAVVALPQEVKATWSAKQAYIALGNLLSAAATLKIDVCPMEGFDANGFDDVLGLKEKGLHTAVIATLGYRSEEDVTKDAAKVRKSTEDLFTTI